MIKSRHNQRGLRGTQESSSQHSTLHHLRSGVREEIVRRRGWLAWSPPGQPSRSAPGLLLHLLLTLTATLAMCANRISNILPSLLLCLPRAGRWLGLQVNGLTDGDLTKHLPHLRGFHSGTQLLLQHQLCQGALAYQHVAHQRTKKRLTLF